MRFLLLALLAVLALTPVHAAVSNIHVHQVYTEPTQLMPGTANDFIIVVQNIGTVATTPCTFTFTWRNTVTPPTMPNAFTTVSSVAVGSIAPNAIRQVRFDVPNVTGGQKKDLRIVAGPCSNETDKTNNVGWAAYVVFTYPGG